MTASWSDACISHRDEYAEEFIHEYFGRAEGKMLWIGGAGFDPRSTHIPKMLKDAKASCRAILIREDRPRPQASLLAQADENEAALAKLFVQSKRVDVSIFSKDEQTVTGGREAVRALSQEDLTDITDIVLDMSALSVGVSFPLAKWLHTMAVATPDFPNVHIMAATSPAQDDVVTSELLDRHQLIAGFAGDLNTEASAGKTKLWLPHLAKGKEQALRVIYSGVQPDETCPILPFPAASPRIVEDLIQAFAGEVRGGWSVDRRDYLYAAENDPLDLYRTILRIDTYRQHTYEVTGGAVTLLSPLGSKVMAMGALMAALERPMPVVYVETQRYAVNGTAPPSTGVVHVWLAGSAYS